VLNELYYRTMLGTNVQVTLGAALNVATFSGGIGGDCISAAARGHADLVAPEHRWRCDHERARLGSEGGA
jgi:hypothetical protein